MKILYYSWEIMGGDVAAGLLSQGHRIEAIGNETAGAVEDARLEEKLREKLRQGFDAVFTMNYFPLISEICQEKGILYISWIYDCPNLTLYSKTIRNSCNRIFSFDLIQMKELVQRGARAKYLPLAVNVTRIREELGKKRKKHFQAPVSFMGDFKEKDAYLDRVSGMPEELRGYLDGLIESQLHVFGYDLTEECFDRQHILELAKCAPVHDEEGFETDMAELYRTWIRKKVTIIERRRLVEMIAEKYPVAIASGADPRIPGTEYIGFLDYYEEMPQVFHDSKINLNFTMRSIRSGIPLRVVDILGAGGFLISNFQPEFLNFFENGKELVWFGSEEELPELVGYYLKHEEERQRIAENGQRIAEQLFSYPVIMKEMFGQL